MSTDEETFSWGWEKTSPYPIEGTMKIKYCINIVCVWIFLITVLLAVTPAVEAFTVENFVNLETITGGKKATDGFDGQDGVAGRDGSPGAAGESVTKGESSSFVSVRTVQNGKTVLNYTYATTSSKEGSAGTFRQLSNTQGNARVLSLLASADSLALSIEQHRPEETKLQELMALIRLILLSYVNISF